MPHSPDTRAPTGRAFDRRAPRARFTSAAASAALCASVAGLGCAGPGDHYPVVQQPNQGSPEAGTSLPPQVHRLPISGGTLLVTRDGATAIAADPDLDMLGVVDVASHSQIATITLHAGDEPGRLAEDAAGRVHVALRRGGAIVTFDPRSDGILARRHVCAAPRGLAYDAAGDVVHVACAGGELVTLPAAGGAPTRSLRLDRDLRDVAIDGADLTVSVFRTAEVLTLDTKGNVTARRGAASFGVAPATFDADVAWRMTALAGGGVLVAHQRAKATAVATGGDHAYDDGTPCGGSIVHGTVTVFAPGGVAATPGPIIPGAALPVDVAVSADGARIAVVAAGTGRVLTGPFAQATDSASVCSALVSRAFGGGAVAAAFTGAGDLVVQTRRPSVWIGNTEVRLFGAAETPADATIGFDAFHRPPSGDALACASCHPEGREDGRTWKFEPLGPRRTQALAGDITGTEPFHWDGELTNLGDVMYEVFIRRMGGPSADIVAKTSLITSWLATVPAPPASPPDDPSSVERGRQLFEAPAVGCATCHSGPKHTNNKTVDVGTGAAMQVPWLVGVGWRAPFMHDGCAATLRDRFGPCGGSKHGDTASLSPGQIADLVAFLETL